MTKRKDAAVSIPRLNIEIVELRLVGTSPLITHAWDGKQKQMMRDKQGKKAKQARGARVPAHDFVGALYWFNSRNRPGSPPDLPKDPDEAMLLAEDAVAAGRFGFPTIGFKSAAVTGAGFVDGITKVSARGAFHVVGEYTELETPHPPVMREDMVRVGMGSADLRYRPMFEEWATTLTIELNTSAMSIEQMINLFNVGGFAAGVGDWRPEKNGPHGRFTVA